MNLLLDTHAFLWFISGDSRLPGPWPALIQDQNNSVFLSVVSLWEAVLKNQIGKLPLPESSATYLPAQRERHGIESLPLSEASVKRLADLPPLHRDPFDRMLICQALAHDLTIVTTDEAILAYSVPVLKGS